MSAGRAPCENQVREAWEQADLGNSQQHINAQNKINDLIRERESTRNASRRVKELNSNLQDQLQEAQKQLARANKVKQRVDSTDAHGGNYHLVIQLMDKLELCMDEKEETLYELEMSQAEVADLRAELSQTHGPPVNGVHIMLDKLKRKHEKTKEKKRVMGIERGRVLGNQFAQYE